jgi:hypothetical protein
MGIFSSVIFEAVYIHIQEGRRVGLVALRRNWSVAFAGLSILSSLLYLCSKALLLNSGYFCCLCTFRVQLIVSRFPFLASSVE